MAEPVYGIDDFPDDDSLWRVEWIGGVGYNTSVPSDPRITVCLTQLPPGETNPLSARARFPAPRLLVARGPIWFGVPYRDALKFTFAQLPGNNGVDVGVVLPGRNLESAKKSGVKPPCTLAPALVLVT